MKFFKNINTMEELKKQYRKLAKKNHPDCGGNLEDMKIINNEYEELFKIMEKDGQAKSHKMDDGFREMVDALVKMNIDIEICGTWIWIDGDTYKVKSELKELGCKWAKAKKKWYWTADKMKKKRSNTDMNKIREIYGSEIVKISSKIKSIA